MRSDGLRTTLQFVGYTHSILTRLLCEVLTMAENYKNKSHCRGKRMQLVSMTNSPCSQIISHQRELTLAAHSSEEKRWSTGYLPDPKLCPRARLSVALQHRASPPLSPPTLWTGRLRFALWSTCESVSCCCPWCCFLPTRTGETRPVQSAMTKL